MQHTGSEPLTAAVDLGPRIGVLGKHPGFGDFVRHGLSDPLADRIDQWAAATLQALRSDLGERWEPFWDRAQTIRVWVGAQVLGRRIAGIMRPSRDKVGRRYPLFLLAEGADVPPPVLDSAQKFYTGLEQHLDAVAPGQGAASLLAGLSAEGADPVDPASESPVIWAHNPAGDLTKLLTDACAVDHARAAQSRSYWWSPPRVEGGSAVWLAQPGLPAAPSLGWLLSGGPAPAAPQPNPEVQDARD